MLQSIRLTFNAICRANNNIAESSPSMSSKTPVSITKNLSDLRLAHARLLEEQGVTVALLRRRGAEIVDLERRESEGLLTIETLQADVHALKEKVGRKEQRVTLAEREVGFLNALVVLTLPFFPFFGILIGVCVLQASFNAEANREGAVLDLSKAQRIEQLETLLQEFKDTNAQLTKEIDALGGDSASLGQGHGRSREALSIEIEQAQQVKLDLQKCTVQYLTYLVPVLTVDVQCWRQQKSNPSNTSTRSKSSNNPSSNLAGKSVRADMSPLACVCYH